MMTDVAGWIDAVTEAFGTAVLSKSLIAQEAFAGLQHALAERSRCERVRKLDEALLVASNYASTNASTTVPLQAAWVRDLKDARIKQFEDEHAQLLHTIGRVKAEREQLKVRLHAVDAKERRFGDASKLALELMQLTKDHASTKHELALLREQHSSRSPGACVDSSTQTQVGRNGTNNVEAGASVVVLQESDHRRGIQLAYQRVMFDLTLENNAVVRSHMLGLVKQFRASLSHASIENQMLHEEMSLCLRRIARLEAQLPETCEDGGVAASKQPTFTHDDKATQAASSPNTSEEGIALLETENAKLKLLLTKFVGVVATRVIVPTSTAAAVGA